MLSADQGGPGAGLRRGLPHRAPSPSASARICSRWRASGSASIPERYLDHVFGEHEFGGTSWLVLAGVPFGSLGLHEGVTHEPLPAIATSFLGVVPLVHHHLPGAAARLLRLHQAPGGGGRRRSATAAVAEALAEADEEGQEKLAAAAEKAAKDKEKAVAAAVKKALAEASGRRAST